MKQFFLSIALMPFVLAATSTAFAAMDMADKRLMPDTIVLNDGTHLHGMIVKNDAKEVVLQQRWVKSRFPRGISVAFVMRPMQASILPISLILENFPPWRMIVQDLRTDDNIHSFKQIPRPRSKTDT